MKTKEQIVEMRDKCEKQLDVYREAIALARKEGDNLLLDDCEKLYSITIHKINLLIDILNG